MFKNFACCLVFAASLSCFATGQIRENRKQSEIGNAYDVKVSPGTEAGAIAYYKDIVTLETGFQTEPRPHLNDLLQYFGYDISGESLEAGEPIDIMNQFPSEVLVSRFFAPKITDVHNLSSETKIGWRKLVRFRTRSGSEADKRGLKSVFILFNFFAKNSQSSPFRQENGNVNHSVNTQVMMIRNQSTNLKPAYFMTFAPFEPENPKVSGRLITYLDATFDAGDPSLPLQRYFVPVACAQCHGRSRIKLNYLDTDHWFDRVNSDDFDDVGAKHALVFDAGTNDTSSVEYKKAFDIIRSINMEIREQNRDADGSAVSFQQRAADSWLKNHATTEKQIPLLQRSIGLEGDEVWDPSKDTDSKLLPLLNRYCFRCHSSINFHVYQKSSVVDRKEFMIERLQSDEPQFFMPQDRTLDDSVKAEIIRLLKILE